MARHSQTPDMLEELETAAERLAGWIATNRWLVVGVLVVVLGAAGVWGVRESLRTSREEAASNALDAERTAYLAALGAPADALVAPKLANPDAARRVAEEFVGRFQGVARDHAGSVAGALALFEAAELLDELGRPEDRAEAWTEAIESTGGNQALAGMLHQRVAQAHESHGRWVEAAEAHERAAALEGYPLHHSALADAARSRLLAGQIDEARALAARVETEAPDLALPPHLRARFRELRAATP